MSRLIDADALIEVIRSHYENVYCEDAVLNNFYRLAHEHVIDVVNIQPTAFDTENVVAELEVQKWEVSDWRDKWRNEIISNCIDIVKRGGIE